MILYKASSALISLFFIIVWFGNAALAQDNAENINRLIDNQKIINQVNLFILYLDSSQIDEYIDTYASNGVFKIENSSGITTLSLEKSELGDFFKPRFAEFVIKGQQRRHLFTNVSIVSQSNNEASVKLNALLTSTQDGKLSLITTMLYNLKLIKGSDNQWRFTEVVSKLDRNLDAKVN